MKTFEDILRAVGNTFFPLKPVTQPVNVVNANSHYNSDPVSALPPAMQQKLAQENAQFLANRKLTPTPPLNQSVGGVLGDSTMVGSPSPTPMPPQAQTPDLWTQFMQEVQKTAPALGFNPDVVIKQNANESAFGTSNFARNRNNFGGIQAYDSNPNQASTFKDIQDYLNNYYKIIQNKFPDAYNNRKDPRKFLEGLHPGQPGGWATNPNYVSDVLRTPLHR